MRASLLVLIALSLVRLSVESFEPSRQSVEGRRYRLQTVVKEIAVGGIAFRDSGDVYVTDTYRSQIHRVDLSGSSTVVAGTGTPELDLHIHVRGGPIVHFA